MGCSKYYNPCEMVGEHRVTAKSYMHIFTGRKQDER